MGTWMPSRAADRVSSPREAFCPPTRGMSARESSSNQHTRAESGSGARAVLEEGVWGIDARAEAGARVIAFIGMEMVYPRKRPRRNGTIRSFCVQPEWPGLDDLPVLGYGGGVRKVLEK